MAPRFQWITFDCYGTLVDWEGGISGAFLETAAGDGVALDASAVLAAHAEIEPEVQAGPYRSYREVLGETALRIAGRLGWTITLERAAFLAHSLPAWRPFPDTNPALVRLRGAGYRLGILSNVDDDLLDGTLLHLPVPFDLVVTAQQVSSYKPAPAHFLAAGERIGGERWLHAAESPFHDVVPCRALGVKVAWINRRGKPASDGGRVDRELRDLRGLADWLAG